MMCVCYNSTLPDKQLLQNYKNSTSIFDNYKLPHIAKMRTEGRHAF